MGFNSGIYQIRNIINNKCYIGSAKDFSDRKHTHFSYLRKNKHYNQHLQSAYNNYGKESLVFEILIYCDIDKLLLYEQLLIDGLKPEYNIRKKAENNFGLQHTEETKRKMSLLALGNKYSVGSKRPDRSIACSGKGNPMYGTHRSGKENPFFGKQHSEETKAKISKASKGKSRNVGKDNPNYGKGLWGINLQRKLEREKL